jgi:hypothetical protein
MRTLINVSVLALSFQIAGCSFLQPKQPLEGVPLEKVINQIKQDLAGTNLSDSTVGGEDVAACGKPEKRFILIRDPKKKPKVTLKLQTVLATDATASAGIAKSPLSAVLLFSGNVSYESKRQVTREQDLEFTILPQIMSIDPQSFSALGKEIYEAEQGILKADHMLTPCLRPTHLSVSITLDVTRTIEADGTIGFKILYSTTAKDVHSTEHKNQVIVDIDYDVDTPPTLN